MTRDEPRGARYESPVDRLQEAVIALADAEAVNDRRAWKYALERIRKAGRAVKARPGPHRA